MGVDSRSICIKGFELLINWSCCSNPLPPKNPLAEPEFANDGRWNDKDKDDMWSTDGGGVDTRDKFADDEEGCCTMVLGFLLIITLSISSLKQPRAASAIVRPPTI